MRKIILLLSLVCILSFSYAQPFTEDLNFDIIETLTNGSASWGDYDGDGDLDLIVSGGHSSNGLAKIYNNNEGVFSDINANINSVAYSSSDWGDYDNDGDLDLLISGGDPYGGSNISKIYNNNEGVFTEIIAGLIGLRNGSSKWGDCDNDGDLDVFLTGENETGSYFKLYLNRIKEDKGFEEVNTNVVGNQNLELGDYDNDGDLDLLLAGNNANGEFRSAIYDNQFLENRAFVKTDMAFTGVQTASIDWGDYDGDGDLDFLLTGSTYPEYEPFNPISKVYRNDGESFVDIEANIINVRGGHSDWGDYDNDGDLDILIGGNMSGGWTSDVTTKIYRNDDGEFIDINVDIPGIYYGLVNWNDYDNDGDLDVFLLDNYSISKVYKNNITISNKLPNAPQNLSYAIDNNKFKLNWDEVTDDETSTNSISYNLKIGTSSGNEIILSANSLDNGYRKIINLGNAQLNNSYTINNLNWDTVYYASVQAIDNSFAGGEFSNEIQFSFDPIQLSDLKAFRLNNDSVLLNWKRGNGKYCILFAQKISGEITYPTLTNNTSYYFNSNFGEGSPVENTNWYCIYKGNEESVTLSGIDNRDSYQIVGYEFQNESGKEIYNTKIISTNIIKVSSASFSEYYEVDFPEGGYSNYIHWGDYDNDGDQDFLMAGGQHANIFRNDISENLGFTNINIDLPQVLTSYSCWIDYDNDNDLDLLFAGMQNSFSEQNHNPVSTIYQNNSGVFTDINAELPDVHEGHFTWGDYDNDGDLDVLVTGSEGHDANPTIISKVFRNESGSFVDANIQLTGVKDGKSVWADYDNDGDLDIILSGYGDQFEVVTKIYQNNASEFTSVNTNLNSTWRGSIELGDYDNDMDLDIIIAGRDNARNSVLKLYNNNSGAFEEKDMGLINGLYCTNWGDVDSDGDLDILISGFSDNDNLSILNMYLNRNNETNSFSELNVDINQNNIYSLFDFDNDGDIDIIPIHGNGMARIYLNSNKNISGNISKNIAPSAPKNLSVDKSGFNVIFNWDHATDLESDSITLTYNLRIGLTLGGNELMTASALPSGQLTVPSIGNVQNNSSWIIKNLDAGQTYFWSVQAVDQGLMGGTWADEQTFTMPSLHADFSANTVCEGLETSFTDLSISPDESIESWEWNFGDGGISSDQNPTYIYNSSGSFSVNLKINTTSYEQIISNDVIVYPTPKADFEFDIVSLGVHTPFANLTDTNNAVITSWNWNFGDGNSYLDAFPEFHKYESTGKYNVILTVESDNGCSNEITKEVSVCTEALLKPDLYVKGPNVVYFACSNDSANYYNWYLNNEIITGAEDYIYVSDKSFGTYRVEISNDDICYIPSDEIDYGTTDIENLDPFANLKIYPNPTPSVFTIEMDNQIYGELITRIFSQNAVEILNIKFDKSTNHFKAQVDLSGQGFGIYIISLSLDKYKTDRKLIVE